MEPGFSESMNDTSLHLQPAGEEILGPPQQASVQIADLLRCLGPSEDDEPVHSQTANQIPQPRAVTNHENTVSQLLAHNMN